MGDGTNLGWVGEVGLKEGTSVTAHRLRHQAPFVDEVGFEGHAQTGLTQGQPLGIELALSRCPVPGVSSGCDTGQGQAGRQVAGVDPGRVGIAQPPQQHQVAVICLGLGRIMPAGQGHFLGRVSADRLPVAQGLKGG